MAIKPISEKPQQKKVVIDLTGPDGNAFALLGKAIRIGRQLSMTEEQIDAILAEMQQSDYNHLVESFDRHFGQYVTLYR